MNAVLSEMADLMRFVVGRPSENLEFWALVGIASLTFIMVLSRTGTAMRFPVSDTGRSIMVLILACGGILAVVAAADIYLSHRLPAGMPRLLLQPVAALLALLVVAVPVLCAVQRGNYLSSLFAMVLSLTAAAVMLLLSSLEKATFFR